MTELFTAKTVEEAKAIKKSYKAGDVVTTEINSKAFGRIAAQKLISPDFRVTSQHGEFTEKGGILFMGTFHPSALLRQESNKPLALSDFQALRQKIKEEDLL